MANTCDKRAIRKNYFSQKIKRNFSEKIETQKYILVLSLVHDEIETYKKFLEKNLKKNF